MASAAGAGSECESEDQEDSSSSHTNDVVQASEAISSLNLQNKESDDELSVFRQEWQRELESTPSPQREPPKETVIEPLTEDEKAKQLFLRGVELERNGKLYEAIQHYKRAMQILPDVETKLYECSELRADSPEEECGTEEVTRVDNVTESDDEDAVEGEDLVARFQRILARKGALCEPAFPTKGAHMSWLPYEVVLLILRWVVSTDLDAVSLERVAAVCRGLYVAARENDIWRSLCVKTWGIDCNTPRSYGYASWRDMFIDRPRLLLNGCYISKTTYLRHGENSFQDQFYRPWYLIDYYRYLRFFPDGVVLMWTTAEEPAACVAQLRYRHAKHGLGIMSGHYRLVGDKVVVAVHKAGSEKKSAVAGNTRFRARRRDSHDHHEQTFHLELQLRSVRSRRNWQLQWRGYAACVRRDQWTQFELTPSKFPPFAFSRVRTYTAEADAPLLCTHAY